MTSALMEIQPRRQWFAMERLRHFITRRAVRWIVSDARKRESNYIRRAEAEMTLAWGERDEEDMMRDDLIELLAMFSTQGHSGSSAPYAANMFKRLALFEILQPLTGEEDEWAEAFNDDSTQQNKRASHVFRRADGTAYDIDAVIFEDPEGVTFTNRNSHEDIEFPYTPSRRYVKVDADGKPINP